MNEHEIEVAEVVAEEALAPTAVDDPPTNDDAVDVVEAEVVDGGAAVFTPAALGLDLPEDPSAREAEMLREIAATRSEASDYLETLQRVAAEFDNYRKRVERDQTDTVLRASQRLVESMLPTLDAFDAALGYETQTPAEEKILDGMRGTHAQLMDTLEREGFAAIEAEGHPFDPAVHEAVAGGGNGDLVVSKELRRGYTLQGRVVRPALVMVGEAN